MKYISLLFLLGISFSLQADSFKEKGKQLLALREDTQGASSDSLSQDSITTVVEEKVYEVTSIEHRVRVSDYHKAALLLKEAVSKYAIGTPDMNNHTLSTTIVLNVPQNAYRDFINEALSKDYIVQDELETMHSQNVSETVLEVQTRLNYKQMRREAILAELAKGKKAINKSELQKELITIEEELRVLEVRNNFWNKQINNYSIVITLYQDDKLTSVDKKKTASFGDSLTDGLGNGWNNTKGFILMAVNYWPLAILFAVGLFFFNMISAKRSKDMEKRILNEILLMNIRQQKNN